MSCLIPHFLVSIYFSISFYSIPYNLREKPVQNLGVLLIDAKRRTEHDLNLVLLLNIPNKGKQED